MNDIPRAERFSHDDDVVGPSSRACFFLTSFLQIILPVCVVIISTAGVHDVKGGNCPVTGRLDGFEGSPLAPCIFIWTVAAASLLLSLVFFGYRYFLRPGRNRFCAVAVVSSSELILAALWLAVVGYLIYQTTRVESKMLYKHSVERITVLVLALILSTVFMINALRTLWKKDVSIQS